MKKKNDYYHVSDKALQNINTCLQEGGEVSIKIPCDECKQALYILDYGVAVQVAIDSEDGCLSVQFGRSGIDFIKKNLRTENGST